MAINKIGTPMVEPPDTVQFSVKKKSTSAVPNSMPMKKVIDVRRDSSTYNRLLKWSLTEIPPQVLNDGDSKAFEKCIRKMSEEDQVALWHMFFPSFAENEDEYKILSSLQHALEVCSGVVEKGSMLTEQKLNALIKVLVNKIGEAKAIAIKTSNGLVVKFDGTVLDAVASLERAGWSQMDKQKGTTNFVVSQEGKFPLAVYRATTFTEICPLGVSKI